MPAGNNTCWKRFRILCFFSWDFLVFAAELPPPYTAIASPDASGVPVINCRVCQSLINLDGKLHQHVVKCTVCNEATVKWISGVFWGALWVALMFSPGQVGPFPWGREQASQLVQTYLFFLLLIQVFTIWTLAFIFPPAFIFFLLPVLVLGCDIAVLHSFCKHLCEKHWIRFITWIYYTYVI